MLKRCGEQVNCNAKDLVVQLSNSQIGEHCAARVEVQNIEQVTRIQRVIAQLEEWRDELQQLASQSVFHHV